MPLEPPLTSLVGQTLPTPAIDNPSLQSLYDGDTEETLDISSLPLQPPVSNVCASNRSDGAVPGSLDDVDDSLSPNDAEPSPGTEIGH